MFERVACSVANFESLHVGAGAVTGHNDWHERRVFTTQSYLALTFAPSSLDGPAPQVRDVIHFVDITECSEFPHGAV